MIKVTFPDGAVREVPSTTRYEPSTEIGFDQGKMVKEPKYDPEWRFYAAIGGWRAEARQAPL